MVPSGVDLVRWQREEGQAGSVQLLMEREGKSVVFPFCCFVLLIELP